MKGIIDILVNYLLKKNIIRISTIEKSFFLYKKLDKEIILSHDIILLNYLSDSPYPSNETKIIAVTEKSGFYLWFNRGEYNHYLPESLLLFRRISEEYSNVIFIIKNEINKVVIIKDGQLVSTFSKHIITKRDLLLIENEYTLSKTVILDKENYSSFLKNSFRYLKLNDILNILDIKLDIKSLFNRFITFSAVPIFVSMIAIFIFVAGYRTYLDEQNQQLYNQYKESQLLTVKIKNKMDKIEDLNDVFNSLSEEFDYEDKVMAISSIIKISKELNITIFYINSYNMNMDFIVKTENSSKIPLFTNKLFKTKLFSNIKNVSSQKIKGKSIKVTMNAKLEKR
jgi:hypothetical protein